MSIFPLPFRYPRYRFTLLCVCLIWVLSLMSPPRVEPLEHIRWFDKLVHTLMYGGTCSILWWEYARSHCRLSWPRVLTWAVAAPILMGGLLEIIQSHTGRSGDWLDFAANSLGVILAGVLGTGVIAPSIWLRKK